YGTETMHVLRAEKGYIIVGQDTDGTVTPDDAGLGWAIGKNKPDFVGKRSLERAAMTSPQRRQLVGLLTTDPQVVLEEGAQVMAQAGARAALWLGPDEWLLIAPEPAPRRFAAALAEALTGLPHSLVDVSHRQSALALSGPQATTLLAAGCPLDLDVGPFPVGMCTRTI